MKFKVNYITTDCILMYLGDYRILFNTPKMNEFLKIDVDWSLIDAILVSDWRYSSSLAYLSEYTLFRGIILATIPTIEFSKYFRPTYSRLCLLEYVYSNYPHEYTTFDVEEMILKIKPIYFNAPVKVVLDLSVTACSSGMTLGGSNWKIQYGSLKFVQVSEWGPGHPYSRLLDITPIVSPDALIISNPVQSKRITYNRRFPDMFSKIDQTLKARSTVLFPTATVDDLFEVLESLHHLLDSAGLQRPVHVLSKTGKHAILNASIFSEWMTKERQAMAITAQLPVLPARLLDKRLVLCHESLEEVLHYAEPRLVVVTREFPLPLIFQSLDAKACVIISGTMIEKLTLDPSFKVPSSRVFYYDKPEKQGLDIKSLIETLKPKNFCMESTEFDLDMKVNCTIPWKVLREEMVDSLYVPTPRARLDLAANHISY